MLPGASYAEGIATGAGATFYAGDLFGGDIYGGDYQRGTAELLIDAPAGRMAVGLKYDQATGLLFVAGLNPGASGYWAIMANHASRAGRRARSRLSRVARVLVDWAGSSITGLLALLVVAGWFVVGLVNGFTDRWFTILFTISGASTFVLVFFVQHATGRDLRAVLLKLDELVAGTDGASDQVKGAERLPLHEQEALEDGDHRSPFVASTREFRTVDDFDELVELVTGRTDLFLRYSEGPAVDAGEGSSRDYEAGLEMSGLSVTTITPEQWWDRPIEDWVARRTCKYAELGEEEDRFPWLLTGQVVGRGPDHEPLVTDVNPLARIGPAALAEAGRRYRQRFDVGEDSRR